jgi:hypothetical protein
VSPAAGMGLADLDQIYADAYGTEPFIRLLGKNGTPDTKNVISTNFLDLGWAWDARAGRYVLMSAIDNLWKGAASQAIQSFNLLNQFRVIFTIFYNNFNDSIFNAGPLRTDMVFKEIIQSKTACMADVLQYNEGIPNISSLIEYNNKTYLIKVLRS